MSSDLPLPDEFEQVLGLLNGLTRRGESLSSRARGLNNIASQSVAGMRSVLEEVKKISGLVKGLKTSLSQLNALNAELRSKLDNVDSDFSQQMSALEANYNAELEKEKAKHAEEISRLQSEISQRSDSEKQQELARLREEADSQISALKASHDAEKMKLVDQYQRLNNDLLSRLNAIAQSQEAVIRDLESVINSDPGEISNSLSTIQAQILQLLNEINSELQNVEQPRQELAPGYGSLSPAVQQAFAMPMAPTQPLMVQPPSSENLSPPEIDLDELEGEGSDELVSALAGAPPTRQDELFVYMLRVLAARARSGNFDENNINKYERLKTEMGAWKQLDRDIQSMPETQKAQLLQTLKSKKVQIYRLTNVLFNETNNIAPTSNELTLQSGGKRKKTRKHKKVHFKTRGKSGGKRRKGGKSRRSGAKKHTKKH